MAARHGKAETINFDDVRRLRRAAGDDRRPRPGRLHRRRRPRGARHRLDRRAGTTRSRPARSWRPTAPHALRQAIHACRKGGTVSIPGVYGGFLDKVPIGAAFDKGLTFKMGQTHVHRYLKPLLDKIERGEIDPSFVITHRIALDDAPAAYKTFKRQGGRLHQGGDQAVAQLRPVSAWGPLARSHSSLFAAAARSLSVVTTDGAQGDCASFPPLQPIATPHPPGPAGSATTAAMISREHRRRDRRRQHRRLGRQADGQLGIAMPAGVENLTRRALGADRQSRDRSPQSRTRRTPDRAAP